MKLSVWLPLRLFLLGRMLIRVGRKLEVLILPQCLIACSMVIFTFPVFVIITLIIIEAVLLLTLIMGALSIRHLTQFNLLFIRLLHTLLIKVALLLIVLYLARYGCKLSGRLHLSLVRKVKV